MNLTSAIFQYLRDARTEGYSPITLRGYQSSLGNLAEFLGNKEVEDISKEDLKNWMHYLRTDYQPERANGNTEPLSTASHHRYWKAMRSFYKWAEIELKTGRPDKAIKMPQRTSAQPDPFTKDEIMRMLEASQKIRVSPKDRGTYTITRPTGTRDHAMLLTLLDTGVRAGELCRMKIRDLDLDGAKIIIQPHHVRKTTPRTVRLSRYTMRAIWRYLETREDKGANDPIFLSRRQKAMTPAQILKLVRSIADEAHVIGAHPHRFRHTFAVEFLRNGGNIYALQDFLGHHTLEMVRRYLHLAEVDSETAHRAASPVARWDLR